MVTRPPAWAGARGGRRVGTLLLAAAVLAVLCGCGARAELGETLPAVGGVPQRDLPPTPKVGECHSLDTPDGDPSAYRVVPCDSPEARLVTFAYGEAAAGTSSYETAAHGCRQAMGEATGLGDRWPLGNLTYVLDAPEARDFALGDTTYRCMLQLYDDSTSLGFGQLPRMTLPTFPDGTLPERYRSCLDVAKRGTPDDEVHYRTCPEGAFRAGFVLVQDIPFATGLETFDRMPTEKHWLAQSKGCDAHGGKDNFALWPGEVAWRQGDRTIVCYYRQN